MKTVHEITLVIKTNKRFIIHEYLTDEVSDKIIGRTGDNSRKIYSGNHSGFFWNIHKFCMTNYDVKNDEVRRDGVRIIEFRRVA